MKKILMMTAAVMAFSNLTAQANTIKNNQAAHRNYTTQNFDKNADSREFSETPYTANEAARYSADDSRHFARPNAATAETRYTLRESDGDDMRYNERAVYRRNDGRNYNRDTEGDYFDRMAIRNAPEPTYNGVRPAQNETIPLLDGRKLVLKGDALYVTGMHNSIYPAPEGAYEASNGLTIYSDDGMYLRAERTADIYMDQNARWNNKRSMR